MIEATHASSGLHDFLATTLAAIDEHLGFGESAFMLAVTNGDRPGDRAYAGIEHGFPQYVMEEYFERWADIDPLTSRPAAAAYRHHGCVDLADVAPSTSGAARRYVEDFLRRTRHPSQLSVRLPAGWSDGYLTVVGPDKQSFQDVPALRELIEPLTQGLRARLPRGVDGVLSMREAQVAELVSLGFTNRQIAGVLHVEEDTVKKHVSHAIEKLGVTRRAPLAVAWATGTRLDLPAPGRLA